MFTIINRCASVQTNGISIATMDDDLYDEFGNYIGDVEDNNEGNGSDVDATETPAFHSYLEEEDVEGTVEVQDLNSMDLDVRPTSTSIVLHEDKQYYPSAEQVKKFFVFQ